MQGSNFLFTQTDSAKFSPVEKAVESCREWIRTIIEKLFFGRDGEERGRGAFGFLTHQSSLFFPFLVANTFEGRWSTFHFIVRMQPCAMLLLFTFVVFLHIPGASPPDVKFASLHIFLTLVVVRT